MKNVWEIHLWIKLWKMCKTHVYQRVGSVFHRSSTGGFFWDFPPKNPDGRLTEMYADLRIMATPAV